MGSKGKEVRVVVLQRSWVVVGYYEKHGNKICVTNGYVIRNWGTEHGIGEIVVGGPTSKTILDFFGTAEVHELCEVVSFICDEAKWRKALQSK